MKVDFFCVLFIKRLNLIICPINSYRIKEYYHILDFTKINPVFVKILNHHIRKGHSHWCPFRALCGSRINSLKTTSQVPIKGVLGLAFQPVHQNFIDATKLFQILSGLVPLPCGIYRLVVVELTR